MKRRSAADCGKIRRIKRNKTESYGSNTFLYIKFLSLWAFVIIADFMLEFRFEFLWPFWLLLRSVHDSFKYKGLAFSVLFVCIAITSDLICLFFIPVHWLFFAASTYVWVQYVWHTDKGICLPTIILWMLFVYLEAAIRWKDSRHMPHLDLCRPFAAHCIGYPVVSLGFGFKSYVGYLMRIRKQREVAKENEFYMELLQQALPQQPTTSTSMTTTDDCQEESSSKTVCGNGNSSSIQTLNGDISCGLLIKDLIATTTNLVTSSGIGLNSSSHYHHKNNNTNNNISNANNNAQTNISNSGSSSRLLSIGSTNSLTSNGLHPGSSSVTTNGHAISVQNISNGSVQNHQQPQNNSKANHHHYHNHHNSTTSQSVQSSEGLSSSNSRKSSHSHNTTTNGENNKCDQSIITSNSNLSHSNNVSNHKSSYHHNHQHNSLSLNPLLLSSSSSSSSSTSLSSANNNNNYVNNSTTGSKDQALTRLLNEIPSQSKEKDSSLKADKSQSSQLSNNLSPILQTENNETLNSTNNLNGSSSSATMTVIDTILSASKKYLPNGAVSTGAESGGKDSTEGNVTLAPEKGKGRKNRSKQKAEKENQQHLNGDNQQVRCTSCSRFEQDMKRMKSEVGHVKQLENELRQKIESTVNLKASLQIKQKENDEQERKIHELTCSKQSDRQNLMNVERRLGEERRQRQSLESQLAQERKLRNKAEEKASKWSDCDDTCKMKKRYMETECSNLRRELATIDEKKKAVEQQNRNYEMELRKLESEFRNRDSQEVLMSALAAMQDKNHSLEKSLSAETRFKLDLFSALGEARREVEIKDSLILAKEMEISDLKAKIAQLLAIMPLLPPASEQISYHQTQNTNPVTINSSMTRLGDGSPSGLMNSNDLNNNSNSNGGNAGGGGGGGPREAKLLHIQQQQIFQQQQQIHVAVSSSSSSLDPNATAYTPKSPGSGSGSANGGGSNGASSTEVA